MTSSVSPLENAATVAEHLAEQFEKDPNFVAAWEKHATPEAEKQLNSLQRAVLGSIFDAAAADTREEQAKFIKDGFNTVIKRTEVMADVVIKNSPQVEAEVDEYFTKLHANPRYAGTDFTQLFEDAGAPVLAAISRKTKAPKV